MKEKITSVILILFFMSCGHNHHHIKKNQQWIMPPNKFPEIFELIEVDMGAVYRVKVKPSSLVFGCFERDDYPHDWCDIEVELIHNSQKYPKKISAVFMASRNKTFTKKYNEMIQKFKTEKSQTYLYLTYTPLSLNNEKATSSWEFLGTFYGLENKTTCINWFNNFQKCQQSTNQVKI